MIGFFSLIGTALGATAANLAGRILVHRETIETAAGVLFIGGLMLLGSALPAVL